jgi:hypothetical protein
MSVNNGPGLTATVLTLQSAVGVPGISCGPAVLLGPADAQLSIPIALSAQCCDFNGSATNAVSTVYTYRPGAAATVSTACWLRGTSQRGRVNSDSAAWVLAPSLALYSAFWTSDVETPRASPRQAEEWT